ncbi:hypothetical protein GCM10010276_50330 [Streptomyces longisporus]|uniref:Uncharacterized protein n=1 Tax=Streptomyces longisporus TaxID=1948 RepID=A0ABN3MGH3_STRLO
MLRRRLQGEQAADRAGCRWGDPGAGTKDYLAMTAPDTPASRESGGQQHARSPCVVEGQPGRRLQGAGRRLGQVWAVSDRFL